MTNIRLEKWKQENYNKLCISVSFVGMLMVMSVQRLSYTINILTKLTEIQNFIVIFSHSHFSTLTSATPTHTIKILSKFQPKLTTQYSHALWGKLGKVPCDPHM